MLSFWPQSFQKNKFFEKKNNKKQKSFSNFQKTGIDVMKLSICYVHAKFWGNLSVFGLKIAKQTATTTYDKHFWLQFSEVLDHLQK